MLSGAVALAALLACSSFSADDDPTSTEGGGPDGGGTSDSTDDRARADATTTRCPAPKAPTTIGFYNPQPTPSFELFARNDENAQRNVFARVEATARPVAFHDTGGRDTVGWYSTVTSSFTILASNTASALGATKSFGAPGIDYQPIAGDWDDDDASQVGARDPSTGNFFLQAPVAVGALDAFQFGPPSPSARPIAGDWDGTGADGIGFFETATGGFFLKNVPANGNADIMIETNHKGPNVWPIAGDWDGCGPVRVGVYDDGTGTVYLLRANVTDAAEDMIKLPAFAQSGRIPIAGRWQMP